MQLWAGLDNDRRRNMEKERDKMELLKSPALRRVMNRQNSHRGDEEEEEEEEEDVLKGTEHGRHTRGVRAPKHTEVHTYIHTQECKRRRAGQGAGPGQLRNTLTTRYTAEAIAQLDRGTNVDFYAHPNTKQRFRWGQTTVHTSAHSQTCEPGSEDAHPKYSRRAQVVDYTDFSQD